MHMLLICSRNKLILKKETCILESQPPTPGAGRPQLMNMLERSSAADMTPPGRKGYDIKAVQIKNRPYM